MSRELQLAWAAGFIDGEGCIYISRANNRGYESFQLGLRVSQRTQAPLEQLHGLFGGWLNSYTATSYTRKTQYLWGVSNAAAGEVLRLVSPFLVVKKDQAELAIRFQEMRTSQERTDPKTGKFVALDKEPYRVFYRQMRNMKVV